MVNHCTERQKYKPPGSVVELEITMRHRPTERTTRPLSRIFQKNSADIRLSRIFAETIRNSA